MTSVTAPFLLLVAAFGAVVAVARRRRRSQLPARAFIVSPSKSTVVNRDGAVRSVQSADLSLPAEQLDRLWNATNLERLARTYWRFLSRVTLGLIRVIYSEKERSVAFLVRPLTILRFDAPEYVMEAEHGQVRWRIKDGILVARAGRGCGFLALDVRRYPPDSDGRARVHIEVEVANFYPSIAAGFGIPVYQLTQSFIHVLVTHAFLRSLARLDLAVSKVGRFAPADEGANGGAPSAVADAEQRP
jgi:hypothetical protein